MGVGYGCSFGQMAEAVDPLKKADHWSLSWNTACHRNPILNPIVFNSPCYLMLGPRYLTTGCGKNGLPSTWLYWSHGNKPAGLRSQKISSGPMLNDEQQNFIIRSMKNNPNFRAFVDGRSELSHEAMKDIAPQTDRGVDFFPARDIWEWQRTPSKERTDFTFFPDVLYSYQLSVYRYIYIYSSDLCDENEKWYIYII